MIEVSGVIEVFGSLIQHAEGGERFPQRGLNASAQSVQVGGLVERVDDLGESIG
jgi:hypothetical protein